MIISHRCKMDIKVSN